VVEIDRQVKAVPTGERGRQETVHERKYMGGDCYRYRIGRGHGRGRGRGI
jgi:hypothetical protein